MIRRCFSRLAAPRAEGINKFRRVTVLNDLSCQSVTQKSNKIYIVTVYKGYVLIFITIILIEKTNAFYPVNKFIVIRVVDKNKMLSFSNIFFPNL